MGQIPALLTVGNCPAVRLTAFGLPGPLPDYPAADVIRTIRGSSATWVALLPQLAAVDLMRSGSLLIGGLGCLGQDLTIDTGVLVTCPWSAVSSLPVTTQPVTGQHCAGEESEDFADGRFLAGGLRQRHVGLDLVAVATAVFVLHHITSFGEIGNDAVGAPLGDAQPVRDVTQPDTGIAGDAQ